MSRAVEAGERALVRWLVWAALLGCRANEPVEGNVDRVDPSWVSGQAAAALDENGQFSTPSVAVPGISLAVANTQARIWLRDFAPSRMNGLNGLIDQHGASFDLASLGLCGRGFLAASAYEPTDSTVPLFAQRQFGPYWLISFCEATGRQIVSLAVSALNTDVRIVDDQLDLPASSGGEFRSRGVPISFWQLPLSPERAVEFAYKLTGVRVAKVPDLHRPPRPQPANLARWRIALEKPTPFVLPDGSTYITDEIWVGSDASTIEGDIRIGSGALPPVSSSYQLLDTITGTLGPLVEFTVFPKANRLAWIVAHRAP